MGAKDIFGMVPPECRVDDDAYSSLVLINLRKKIEKRRNINNLRLTFYLDSQCPLQL